MLHGMSIQRGDHGDSATPPVEATGAPVTIELEKAEDGSIDIGVFEYKLAKSGTSASILRKKYRLIMLRLYNIKTF
jgi:hypothetical protein